MKTLAIILPALNEEGCIKPTIQKIPVQQLLSLGFNTRVVVVDNGSTDGTAKEAEEAGAMVLYQPWRGYGYAIRKGCDWAFENQVDYITKFDADGTYPSYCLPYFLLKMETEGLDFLVMSRLSRLADAKSYSWYGQLGNHILCRVAHLLFRVVIHDLQSGMWVIRSEYYPVLNLQGTGMELSQEIKIKAATNGLRWDVVRAPFTYRLGRSKLRGWKDGLRCLVHLFELRLSMSRERI